MAIMTEANQLILSLSIADGVRVTTFQPVSMEVLKVKSVFWLLMFRMAEPFCSFKNL